MNNMNNNNLEALLKIVGNKLNISPQDLRQQLETGKFDSAMKNMRPNDAMKFQQILNNPKLAEQFMSAPQAQQLYKKIMGE